MNSPSHIARFPLFNLKVLFFLLVISLLCFFLYRDFVLIKSQDEEEYRKILVNIEKPAPAFNPYVIKQQREGVAKDFFFVEKSKPERYQLRLLYSHSDIVLDRQEEQTEIVEKMKNVRSIMQEELYFVLPDGSEAFKQTNGKFMLRHNNGTHEIVDESKLDTEKVPMQIIRYLVADNATYHYKTNLFTANQVSLSRYKIPSHQLVDSIDGFTPLMVGLAEKVEFSLGGQSLNFKAYKFKATFFGEFK